MYIYIYIYIYIYTHEIPDLPRRNAVAEFRFCVGHDCLDTHVHRIGIRPDPYCTLCTLREPIDRSHLRQCAAIFNRTECERYWESRIKMMVNRFCFFSITMFMTTLYCYDFIFTLNIVYSTNSEIFSVILIFYFCWSHRPMINNQCTCH